MCPTECYFKPREIWDSYASSHKYYGGPHTIGERYVSQAHRELFQRAYVTALIKSGYNYDDVAEHMGLGYATVCGWGQQGTPHHWTPRVEQFLGLKPNELIKLSGFVFCEDSYKACLDYWHNRMIYGRGIPRPPIHRVLYQPQERKTECTSNLSPSKVESVRRPLLQRWRRS